MAEITSAKLSIDPRLLPGAGARVLDVGCGDGRHLRAVALRGARAVGIDYDAAAVHVAREQGVRSRDIARSCIDYIVCDAARLPFRPAAFDGVICTETLEHLPNDTGAIAEIARVLRRQGILLGAVPSHFTERLYWRLSRGYWDTPGGHVRIYTPRTLTARLADHGLRMESMRYLHFVDSVFWLRFCLTDFLRGRRRPQTAYAQAIAIAVAQERATVVPTWRARLREAFGRSRFIALVDAAGAYVWPKSFAFVARKHGPSAR